VSTEVDWYAPPSPEEVKHMSTPRRCKWCGVFVRHDQPLTGWRVQVAPGSRQDPESPWNYWARLLCPGCAAAIDHPPIWEQVTVDEVLRQRGALRAPVVR
jgi:hypothetical protein